MELEKLTNVRENPTEEKTNLVNFTEKEGYEKYLNLHECYQKYINMKGIEKVDYITYLSTFDHLFDIPKESKNAEYRRYVESLLEYLMDFLGRVKPLLDINKELTEANKDFEAQWETNSFPGWPKEADSAWTKTGVYLELSVFSSWEELASLGLDRLKSALMALGLKCGGTLKERAQRLFSTKGKSSLDPKLLAKKQRKLGKGKNLEKQKEIAHLEAQVYKLSELVGSQRNAIKKRTQREQGQTESEHRDSGVDTSASEEEDEFNVFYNPKNLPLFCNGKPIPNCSDKFQKLDIHYSCEVCGDFIYIGPKAFHRHFTEWRHAYGIRRLGIPKTIHIADVTQTKAALALWEDIKLQKQTEKRQPGQEKYEGSLKNINLERLLKYTDLETLEKLNLTIEDLQILNNCDNKVKKCILNDFQVIELLCNNKLDLSNFVEFLEENRSEFIDARTAFSAAEIIKKYEENPDHLIFMSGEPTDIIKCNYFDKDVIFFGLKHYNHEISLLDIRETLAEQDCKEFNEIVDRFQKENSN